MQLKTEILDELRQLSMVVAGIPRQMPYEVPEGYFAAFPEKMVRHLQAGTENTFSPGWGKASVFSVPDGYFEGFASRMMNKIKATQGEFQDAREELASLSPLLSGIDKSMPYQVPAGYFDMLEIGPLVSEENLSPQLAALKDITAYQVPEGYFESFPEIMSARVRPAAAPAKVISINHRRRTWWQYSAAAVVIAFTFTIGWLRLHTPTVKPGLNSPDVTQGLARVSDQDIQSYLDNRDNHTAPVQQDDFYGKSTAALEFSDNDIKNFLGDISDNELTQYMEEHGDLKDYPTN